MPHGVMFHHFYNNKHPQGQGAICAQDLEDIIRLVGRENILTADEWLHRATAGELRDTDVCLTFDDALRCQFDIAFPVLQNLGLTGFWFVYSSVLQGIWGPLEIYRYFRTTQFKSVDDFYSVFFESVEKLFPQEYRDTMAVFQPEKFLADFPFYSNADRTFRYLRDDVLGVQRYHDVMQSLMLAREFDQNRAASLLWMNEDDIRVLHRAGHQIGLHSYTHPTRLAELDERAQAVEYEQNFAHLSGVIGESPSSMAHPCNSYSQGTLSLLQRMGIKIGFRSNAQDVPERSSLEYPRQDHAILMRKIRHAA